MNTRELFARLIKCEAGGEGIDGMQAVATVIMNRATVSYGEFFRISQGGDIRNIILQTGQFVCARTSVSGQYNPQNIYNMSLEPIDYKVADWAIGGNLLNAVGNSLFFFNPYSEICPMTFPPNGVGTFYSRVGNHCFYAPTEKYAST